MEVVLPSTISQSLLQYAGDITGTSVYCYVNNRIPTYYLTSRQRSDYDNSKYTMSPPPKAIYQTSTSIKSYFWMTDTSKYSSNNGYLANGSNYLPTVPIKHPAGFPQSDYYVDQSKDTIIPGLTDAYPTNTQGMIDYLNQLLPEYNGEPRYKIIRRYVYLTRVFGSADGDLLLVDCDTLFKEVNSLVKACGREVTRDISLNMSSMIGVVKAKLLGSKLDLPMINPTIMSLLETRIAETTSVVNMLHQIYVASSEIATLRNLLNSKSDDVNQVNGQLVESAEMIRELRTKVNDRDATIADQANRITVIENELANLKSELASIQSLNRKLNSNLLDANKKINILEINAAKDEAIIRNLRAEKAYWNTTTGISFEEKEKRESEIAKLHEMIDRLC